MKGLMKVTIVLLVIALMLSFAACGSQSKNETTAETSKAVSETAKSTEAKTYKIGYTVQDLSNPIWADTAEECKKLAAQKGMQITVLDCKANAATQISQMENFIQDGVDAIVINPADATALKDVMMKALAKDIKILSYDVQMVDMGAATAEYLVSNYDLGVTIGTEAAKWINEKLGGQAEVGVFDYPQIPDIIDRANGIIDAIKKNAPNAKIVAQASAATVADGMKNTENFLQAHPNMKVIASIGDGGAIGANEAVKAAGKNTEDFGIFSADATQEALSKLANGESIRMTVSLEAPVDRAKRIIGVVEGMLNNTLTEKKFYFAQTPIDASNVSQFYKP